MEDAGQKLKRARERLDLRYRDVEEASLIIASRHKNDEFAIALSRLADIENRGTLPSLFRLYSLCAIYRLDLAEVLEWYGVRANELPADAARISLAKTHEVRFSVDNAGEAQFPLSLEPGIDLRRTTYLSRLIQRWGKLPLMLLGSMDLKHHRYAFVGTEDWSMYPLIQPGSLLLIDDTRRKIAETGWTTEFERPIYFLEHRGGWLVGWCVLEGGHLTVLTHPASPCAALTFDFPEAIDVIGQVTGVAMRLDQARRRRIRS